MTKGDAFDFSTLRKKPTADVPKEVEAKLDAVADRHGFRSREVAAEEPSKRVDRRRKSVPKASFYVRGDADKIERFRNYCIQNDLGYIEAIVLLMDGNAPKESQ